MEAHYAIVPVAVIVVVILAVALTRESPLEIKVEEPVVGSFDRSIAISEYDLSNVTVNSQVQVAVARIYNTGTLPLNVTVHWISDQDIVSATVQPPTFSLQPEESLKVYADVAGRETGVCEGTFQVEAAPENSGGGNLVKPGGSVEAVFKVVETT